MVFHNLSLALWTLQYFAGKYFHSSFPAPPPAFLKKLKPSPTSNSNAFFLLTQIKCLTSPCWSVGKDGDIFSSQCVGQKGAHTGFKYLPLPTAPIIHRRKPETHGHENLSQCFFILMLLSYTDANLQGDLNQHFLILLLLSYTDANQKHTARMIWVNASSFCCSCHTLMQPETQPGRFELTLLHCGQRSPPCYLFSPHYCNCRHLLSVIIIIVIMSICAVPHLSGALNALQSSLIAT